MRKHTQRAHWPRLWFRVAIAVRLTPMTHSSRHNRSLAALVCLALLMMRVGGAHLHLCFDGTEPPASFHVFDVDLHHESPGASVAHQDADVAVTADLYSKPSKAADQLPLAPLMAIVALASIKQPRQYNLRNSARALHGVQEFLRPPLRGPPLLISL